METNHRTHRTDGTKRLNPLSAAVKKQTGPSLKQSIGCNHKTNNQRKEQTITIIKINYLKNLREELLEEDGDSTNHNNNKIAYTIAEINGVHTKIMIDTGVNYG